MENLSPAWNNLLKIINDLNDEDKSQFLKDSSDVFKDRFKLNIDNQVLFPGIDQLIKSGLKRRWKPSFLIITINSYETKKIRQVLGRLNTFAKKHKIELVELNVGEDMSDTYFEIAAHMKNKWHEYKLIFEEYIDNDMLFEFLEQFPEIEIGPKSSR